MKSIKRMTLGVMLVASLVGASSASAANWDPQGTSVTGTQIGTAVLNAGSATVSCSVGDTNLTASGAVATASGSNPIRWTNCVNSVSSLLSTSVVTAGTWAFTANSTTNVGFTGDNGSGAIATITIGSPPFGCSITVGHTTLANNVWDNATHRLTTNSGTAFPIAHSGICPGVGSTATMAATFQLPTSVIIT